MARERWVFRDGRMVQLDLDAPRPKPVAPMIMKDIDAYRCVVDGEMITSRSRHRQKLKETGCIEWGNQRPWQKQVELPPVAADLKRAVEQVKAGHKPAPLESGIIPRS